MKKAYLIALAIIVLSLGAVYFRLFTQQIDYKKSIMAESGIFLMDNISGTGIKIIIAKTDFIIADIKGPRAEIAKLRLLELENGNAEFGFIQDVSGLSGTITIPENMILDVKESKGTDFLINDKNAGKTDGFVLFSGDIYEIDFNDNGNIYIKGPPDTNVYDKNTWKPIKTSVDESDDDDDIPECEIGSQVVRNYCCERKKEDETNPLCDGYGYWAFNNSTRECEFKCEAVEVQQDCSIGSQYTRDTCCVSQNVNTQKPDCVGKWLFNNSSRICEFHCYTEEELEDYFGGGGIVNEDNDAVTKLCSDFPDKEDRDECCDYNLRTPLSIGPYPGFPDCIGKWYFSDQKGCQFQCASYEEMLEILKELQKNVL